MRLAQDFSVARPPEVVFDYVTTPAKLPEWQTTKTSVEQVTDGPPGLGTQVRERTKPPGGNEFEQLVEFTEFERPRRLRVHIVEGPQPIDGIWTFDPEGDGTRARFQAEGRLRGPLLLLTPVVKRMIARQFREVHENLRRNLEQ